jgi:hypothetical protein
MIKKSPILSISLFILALVATGTSLSGYVFGVKSRDSYTVLFDHTIFITVFFASCIILGERYLDTSKNALNGDCLERYFNHIWLLILVCAVGCLFNILDKYWIIKLRSIECLSSIRFAWLEIADRGREPVHDIVSLVGNILSSLIFPTTLIIASRFFSYKHRIEKQNYLQLIACVSIVILYCGLFASRNLMFAFSSLCFCSSIVYFLLAPTRQQLLKTVAAAALAFCVSAGFLITLTNDRIFCVSERYKKEIELGGKAAELKQATNYLKEFENELHFKYNANELSKSCPGCVLGAIYLNHGMSNHEAIFDDDKIGKNYIWSFISSYIENVVEVPDFEYVRNFTGGISAVGAFRHDFGYLGIIFAAIFTAMLVKIISIGLVVSNHSVKLLSVLVFYVFMYSVTTSLMFVPFMTMPFSLMLFGFLFFYVLTLIYKTVATVKKTDDN